MTVLLVLLQFGGRYLSHYGTNVAICTINQYLGGEGEREGGSTPTHHSSQSHFPLFPAMGIRWTPEHVARNKFLVESQKAETAPVKNNITNTKLRSNSIFICN